MNIRVNDYKYPTKWVEKQTKMEEENGTQIMKTSRPYVIKPKL